MPEIFNVYGYSFFFGAKSMNLFMYMLKVQTDMRLLTGIIKLNLLLKGNDIILNQVIGRKLKK